MTFLELLGEDLLGHLANEAPHVGGPGSPTSLVLARWGEDNPEITGLEHDSRRVRPGNLFVAMRGESTDAPHNTPESLELNRLFARGASEGAREAVMEVSSHALAQERVWGLEFETAVFTNLTRDHLDYHRDFEDYFAAKRVLFTGC